MSTAARACFRFMDPLVPADFAPPSSAAKFFSDVLRLSNRADPKNTTVSWICSRRNRAKGSEYSDKMRRTRPSGLSRKAWFSYARGARLGWLSLMVRFHFHEAGVSSGVLPFVVVDRFPESNPNVQHTQTAANSAHKSVGDKCPQRRIHQQQTIVGPLRPPGKNNQQHTDDGTDEYKQQYRDPMQPEVEMRSRNRYAVSGWRFTLAGNWPRGIDARPDGA